MSTDKPYAGKVMRFNVRLEFPTLFNPKEQPTMIDKSKPFYKPRRAKRKVRR